MCSGPAQEAERDGGKTNRMSSDTQREVHGEPSERTKKTLVTRGRGTAAEPSMGSGPVMRPKYQKQKSAFRRNIGSLLRLSPTYSVLKSIAHSNDDI